jgi:hypothetical protein
MAMGVALILLVSAYIHFVSWSACGVTISLVAITRVNNHPACLRRSS